MYFFNIIKASRLYLPCLAEVSLNFPLWRETGWHGWLSGGESAGHSPLWPGFDSGSGHVWTELFVSCVVLSHATRDFSQVLLFSSLNKNQHCEERCMIKWINVEVVSVSACRWRTTHVICGYAAVNIYFIIIKILLKRNLCQVVFCILIFITIPMQKYYVYQGYKWTW